MRGRDGALLFGRKGPQVKAQVLKARASRDEEGAEKSSRSPTGDPPMSLRSSNQELAVLALAQNSVEWLPGTDLEPLSGGDFAADDPRGRVEACLEAVRFIPRSTRRCMLALGPGWVETRTLDLPSLPRREFARVVQRKAAALLSTPLEDTLFAALPLFDASESSAAAGDDEAARRNAGGRVERPWLVLGMRRSLILPLLLGLRREKIRVVRIVSSRLAALSAVMSRIEDPERACLAVTVEADAVSIGLLHRGALRSHGVVEGRLNENSTLALSLLQDLKSTEAWWRRQSRGGKLSDLALIGLAGPRGDLLRDAIQSALPEVKVQRNDPGRSDEMLMQEALAAARLDGPLQLDLSVRLPWRRRDTLVAASLCASGVLLLGARIYTGFERERDAVEAQVRALEADAHELEQARAENDSVAQALTQRIERLSELAQIEGAGCDLDALLESALGACAGHAALLRLSVRKQDGRRSLELAAETAAHPALALAHVQQLTRALRETGRFGAIEARAAEQGQLGGAAARTRPSAFVVQAELRSDG